MLFIFIRTLHKTVFRHRQAGKLTLVHVGRNCGQNCLVISQTGFLTDEDEEVLPSLDHSLVLKCSWWFLIASTGNNLYWTRQKERIPLSPTSCWNHSMSEAIVNCEQTYKWSSLTMLQLCTNNCEVFICQPRKIQTVDGFNFDWWKNGYFLTIF